MKSTLLIAAIAALVLLTACKGEHLPTEPIPTTTMPTPASITTIVKVEGAACRVGAIVDVKLVNETTLVASKLFAIPVGQFTPVDSLLPGMYRMDLWYADDARVTWSINHINLTQPTSGVTIFADCPVEPSHAK